MTVPSIRRTRESPSSSGSACGSPFDLANESAYRQWRADKLAAYPISADVLIVDIEDISDPDPMAIAALTDTCRVANMAIYRFPPDAPPVSKTMLRAFAARFGLTRLHRNPLADDDGITSLAQAARGPRRAYIPYSSRALDWHTDGYYNKSDEPIRAMLLHCASPAAEGGINGMLDHEIAYIWLRDADADLVAALMHPEAMTIPANMTGRSQIRPPRTGPVFSIDSVTGALHMRYTARPTHVVWRDDPTTRAAVQRLSSLLNAEEPPIIRHRLAAGQGIICNNVLHNRTAFRNGEDRDGADGRLLYRARFLDRIADT